MSYENPLPVVLDAERPNPAPIVPENIAETELRGSDPAIWNGPMTNEGRHARKLADSAEKFAEKVQKTEPAQVTRRAMLKGAFAAMVLGSLYEAKREVNPWWQSGRTRLQMVDKGLNPNNSLFGVTFGGLGNFDPRGAAFDVAEVTNHAIPQSAMIISNQYGENLGECAKVLQQARDQREFPFLALNCLSLGGLFGLYSALMANIPVGAVSLGSTPGQLDNARDRFWAQLVASRYNPHNKLITTGELLGTDIADDIHNEGFVSFAGSVLFGDGFPELLNNLQREGSPELHISQLEIAKTIHLNHRAVTDAFKTRRIITKNTQAWYVKTRYWRQDGVVAEDPSIRMFKSWFKEFDVDMGEVVMPANYSRHADAWGCAIASRENWRQAINTFDGLSYSLME